MFCHAYQGFIQAKKKKPTCCLGRIKSSKMDGKKLMRMKLMETAEVLKSILLSHILFQEEKHFFFHPGIW